MVSDNIRHPSLSRKAGRGLMRALRGLFGGRSVRKAGESWRVLKEEYRKGKAEAEEREPAPRRIPHRELDGPPSDPGGADRS
jgi:hypothetical protein